MLLNLTDLSAEPLQKQMFRQLRALILTSRLGPGLAIPSIRAMAREQRVSVITVQRAYEDLEREGLIRSRRGKGFFVNELSDNHRTRLAEDRAFEAMNLAIREASAEGLRPQQIRLLVERILTGEENTDDK